MCIALFYEMAKIPGEEINDIALSDSMQADSG